MDVPTPHPAAAPETIGGYRVLRRLGSGGMGVVYLCADPTGRRVAVKVIHPDRARDPGFQRRFTREVAAARRVARFCTAPVLDAGVDGEVNGGLAYLVTEYVDGPDLATVVRERGPLAGSNLESLAAGVAVALHAIHRARVVHRDLKPSNVVLSGTGPRVIDFGIAQLVEPDSEQSQTAVGTPAFMAPEQVHGHVVSPATDVFAWGALVAYAGTGRLPFGGGPPAEVLYRVTHGGPDLDELDPRLRPLVERALAKRPEARPTAEQLLGELMGGPAPEPAAATELVEQTWTSSLVAPPAARPRRWWLPVAGLAAAAAVALLGAFGLRALAGDRPAELPYQAGFATGWQQDGTATVHADGYLLTSDAPRRLVWRSAPLGDLSGVVVTAEARLTSGSGEFGVWCAGTHARYRFGVDSAGRAGIVKDQAGGAPVRLRGPVQLADTGLTGTGGEPGWLRITAECREAGGAALGLWLDGAAAGSATDPGGGGAGEVGVYALADAAGSATVAFRSFTVSSSR